MIKLVIKEQIEASGMSVAQVARLANISNDTLYALCREPNKPVNTRTLEKIAKVLNVSVKDLFTEE
jgi:DNA-binding Xre family transcriptional regulator